MTRMSIRRVPGGAPLPPRSRLPRPATLAPRPNWPAPKGRPRAPNAPLLPKFANRPRAPKAPRLPRFPRRPRAPRVPGFLPLANAALRAPSAPALRPLPSAPTLRPLPSAAAGVRAPGPKARSPAPLPAGPSAVPTPGFTNPPGLKRLPIFCCWLGSPRRWMASECGATRGCWTARLGGGFSCLVSAIAPPETTAPMPSRPMMSRTAAFHHRARMAFSLNRVTAIRYRPQYG